MADMIKLVGVACKIDISPALLHEEFCLDFPLGNIYVKTKRINIFL